MVFCAVPAGGPQGPPEWLDSGPWHDRPVEKGWPPVPGMWDRLRVLAPGTRAASVVVLSSLQGRLSPSAKVRMDAGTRLDP
jgi:hypothetical protein